MPGHVSCPATCHARPRARGPAGRVPQEQGGGPAGAVSRTPAVRARPSGRGDRADRTGHNIRWWRPTGSRWRRSASPERWVRMRVGVVAAWLHRALACRLPERVALSDALRQPPARAEPAPAPSPGSPVRPGMHGATESLAGHRGGGTAAAVAGPGPGARCAPGVVGARSMHRATAAGSMVARVAHRRGRAHRSRGQPIDPPINRSGGCLRRSRRRPARPLTYPCRGATAVSGREGW